MMMKVDYKEKARLATEWCEKNAKGTPTAWEWEEKFAELLTEELSETNRKLESALNTIQTNIKPMVNMNEKLLEINDKLNKIIDDSRNSNLKRIAIAIERIVDLRAKKI